MATLAVIGAVTTPLIIASGAAGSRGGSTLGYSLVCVLGGGFGLIYLWVDVTILYGAGKRPTSQRSLLLIGPDGRCLFNLRAAAWTADGIQAFVAATGRASEVRIAPLTAREARREFPGPLAWIVAHPSSVLWMMIAIAVATIVVFVVLARR